MRHNHLYLKIATGVSLLLIGALVLMSDYIKEKRDVVFSDMNLVLSELQETVENEEEQENIIIEEVSENIEVEEPVEEPVDVSNNEPKKAVVYEKYLGTLKISRIDFYRGFYSKESNLNKVKYNLYVLPQSDYPDVEKGNLIIAGHSGNYNNSYFKNLYMLEVGDEAIVTYNNANYIYKIDKIYDVLKVGTVRVLRNTTKTTLTLITCTKDDKEHQTVYIAYLDRIE